MRRPAASITPPCTSRPAVSTLPIPPTTPSTSSTSRRRSTSAPSGACRRWRARSSRPDRSSSSPRTAARTRSACSRPRGPWPRSTRSASASGPMVSPTIRGAGGCSSPTSAIRPFPARARCRSSTSTRGKRIADIAGRRPHALDGLRSGRRRVPRQHHGPAADRRRRGRRSGRHPPRGPDPPRRARTGSTSTSRAAGSSARATPACCSRSTPTAGRSSRPRRSPASPTSCSSMPGVGRALRRDRGSRRHRGVRHDAAPPSRDHPDRARARTRCRSTRRGNIVCAFLPGDSSRRRVRGSGLGARPGEGPYHSNGVAAGMSERRAHQRGQPQRSVRTHPAVQG